MIFGMPFDFPENCADTDKYSYTANEERMFIAAEYTDGVFPQIRIVKNNILEPTAYLGECLKVAPSESGLGIVVSPGIGICGSTKFCNTAGLLLDFSVSAEKQIFDIVVETNFIKQDVQILVIKRAGNIALENALVRTASIYQIALATVEIPANAIIVNISDVIDHRLNTNLCPNGKPICGLVGAVMQADTRMIIDDIRKEWAHFKGQLAGDVAGNLQLQIDELTKYNTTQDDTANADRLAIAMAQQTADRIYAVNPYDHSVTFNASGTWICPEGVTRVGIFIQDGGNGGYGSFCSSAYDGYVNAVSNGNLAESGAHTTIKSIPVISGQSYPIIIGAGGLQGKGSEHKNDSTTYNKIGGLVGGSSTAFGKNVNDGLEFKGKYQSDTVIYYTGANNYSKTGFLDLGDISLQISYEGNDSYNNRCLAASNISAAATSKHCDGCGFNAITYKKVEPNGGAAGGFATTKGTYYDGQAGKSGVVIIYY